MLRNGLMNDGSGSLVVCLTSHQSIINLDCYTAHPNLKQGIWVSLQQQTDCWMQSTQMIRAPVLKKPQNRTKMERNYKIRRAERMRNAIHGLMWHYMFLNKYGPMWIKFEAKKRNIGRQRIVCNVHAHDGDSINKLRFDSYPISIPGSHSISQAN